MTPLTGNFKRMFVWGSIYACMCVGMNVLDCMYENVHMYGDPCIHVCIYEDVCIVFMIKYA